MSESNEVAAVANTTVVSENKMNSPFVPPDKPPSNIPTPASSVTGVPVSRMKAPTNFGGSSSSISKIGRLCSHTHTPKAGPPPRDTNSMSRESDDNLSSINSAYTDLYQETVRRFTRSSLSPEMERTSPFRYSFKSTTPSSQKSSEYERHTTHDSYIEATGRRRSSDHGAILTANTEQFIIGQRVWVGGIRPGQIAFIGETHFAPGDWAGIVLDEANGKNDGCVAGKRYFQCEAKRGIFSRLTRLTLAPLASAPQTPTSPFAKFSPDRSRTVSPTASVRSSFLRSPGKDRPQVGDRVIVSSGFGSRPGILRYLGETKFASGNWCGIELDEPTGKNDGAVDGIRYFECQPKYGVFVPIAKVSLSPSSKKSRLSRTGSRESLTSIGTMNSIATTNTSRMRMSAQQRKFSTLKPSAVSPPKSQFSMQDMLRERQTQIEQIMIERDMDRHEAHNQGLQYQKRIDELEEKLKKLEKTLLTERKRNEELQSSVDEATFCGDELDAQSQVYKERIQDLERKVQTLSAVAGGGSQVDAINAATEAANEEIKQLRAKLESQAQAHQTQLSEIGAEGKKVQQEIERLQQQLRETGNKSNNEQENLKRELESLKNELSAKENEIRQRNSDFESLNDQLIKQTAELSVKKAECATLDELLRAQEMGNSEGQQMVAEKLAVISKLKEEINELRKRNETTETGLKQTKEELESTTELKTQLETQLKELAGGLESKQESLEKLDQSILELTRKYEQTSNENIQLKAEIESAKQANESLKSTEGDLGTKLHDMEKAVERANNDLEIAAQTKEQLETKIKECEELLKTTVEAKQRDEEALKIEIEALEDKIQLLQSESQTTLKGNTDKIDELVALVNELQQNLSKRENQLRQIETESDRQKSLLNEKVLEIKSTTEALESTTKLIEKLQQELESFVERSKQLEIELKQSEEQKAQQQLELGDASRKLEALSRKCEALTTLNESLQQDVLATRTSGSELQTELRRLNEEIQAKQKSYAELASKGGEERHNFESKIVELQQKLGNASKDLEEAHQNAQKSKTELEAHKLQITTLEEQLVRQELALSDAMRQQQNMQTKTDSLAAQNEALQSDLTTLRTSSTDSNAELLKLAADLAAKQKAFEELLDKSNGEKSALESELQMRQQRIDALCSQVETLTKELSGATEESFKRFESLKLEQEKTDKQSLEVADLTRKLDSTNTKCGALETENANLQKELTTLRNASTDSSAEVLKLSAEISSKQKSLQELNDKSNANRLELENKLQEHSQRLEAMQSQAGSLRQELEAANEAKTKQQAEFELLKASMLQEAQQQLESLQASHAEQQSKLSAEIEQYARGAADSRNSNQEAVKSLENEMEKLKTELHKCQAEAKEQQTTLLKKIEELETEKSTLHASVQTLQSESATTLQNEAAEKQKLQTQIESLASALTEKEQVLQSYQTEVMQAQLAKENTNSDLNQTQIEVKSLHEALELIKVEREHQAKLAEADKRKIEELESLLEAFKKSNAQMSATNAQLVESLQMAEIEKNEISQIFELFEMESDQTSTQLVGKLSSMKHELEQAQNKAKSMDAALQTNREKSAAALQEAQAALAALQTNATVNSTKLSDLQKERDFVVQNGQILEQEYNNLRQTLENYKAERELEISELRKRISELQSKPKQVVDGSGDNVALLSTNGENSMQIDFLHSIIADMQQKNDTLKAKIKALEALPTDFTQPNAFDLFAKRKPAPRVFCDICDEFDKHETEDCPIQASDERDVSPVPLAAADEQKERKIPPPRKYCETCEVFGHETGECDGEECF